MSKAIRGRDGCTRDLGCGHYENLSGAISWLTFFAGGAEQVLVSVACNGAHSLKQRLARWLLMMRDRGDDDALQITQNLLAEMLGVQRPTITNAARELERAGLIARGRRQVTILDRQGLVEASCECYLMVRARVSFHLPKTYAQKSETR